MSEEKDKGQGDIRDRQASRRDVDAAIRDRMADEDMATSERDAREHAARDRMAAMQDRQAAARERHAADDEHRRSSETTADAEDA